MSQRTVALVVYWLWHSAGMRDQGLIPCWDTEFCGLSEPTVTFGTQCGLHHLFVWSKCKDTLSPERDECHSGQLSWWSNSYDTCQECERPGFDPPLRHWIFPSFGTHYSTVLPLKIIGNPIVDNRKRFLRRDGLTTWQYLNQSIFAGSDVLTTFYWEIFIDL